MALKLIKLSKEYQTQLIEMIEEWKIDHLNPNANKSPWAIFRHDYHDFDYYLNNLEYRGDDPRFVPNSVFFLLDEERNKLIGAVDIRHHLNEQLLYDGGHIGDGIRPSERRKGYGNKIIALALEECRKLGIDKVLIVCDKDNVGSQKAIINNGGALENEVISDRGIIEQRYWITLK